ncbi:MAG: hypothetical protein U0169_07180 [Polyangiaceae bacterium]
MKDRAVIAVAWLVLGACRRDESPPSSKATPETTVPAAPSAPSTTPSLPTARTVVPVEGTPIASTRRTATALAVDGAAFAWTEPDDPDAHEVADGGAPRARRATSSKVTNVVGLGYTKGALHAVEASTTDPKDTRLVRPATAPGTPAKVVARGEGWLPPLVPTPEGFVIRGAKGLERVDVTTGRGTTLVALTGRTVLALACDDVDVFWLERPDVLRDGRGSVFRVPLAGGTPTELARTNTARIARPMRVDATDVYWLEQPDMNSAHVTITKVAKSGGPVSVIAAAPRAVSLALSDTAIYWGTLWQGSDVHAIPKTGGSSRVVASSSRVVDLAWSDGELTWISDDGVRRVSAP